jgi:hypothetical protein
MSDSLPFPPSARRQGRRGAYFTMERLHADVNPQAGSIGMASGTRPLQGRLSTGEPAESPAAYQILTPRSGTALKAASRVARS